MKKFFVLVLGMTMLMLIPINVKADDEVEIGVDQEESNIEYVEINQEMEPFSVGHKVSLSINPNVEKRIGSYKLEANKYVRLKFIYSSTSKVKVGIVNKSRSKVTLKEIKSNVFFVVSSTLSAIASRTVVLMGTPRSASKISLASTEFKR